MSNAFWALSNFYFIKILYMGALYIYIYIMYRVWKTHAEFPEDSVPRISTSSAVRPMGVFYLFGYIYPPPAVGGGIIKTTK